MFEEALPFFLNVGMTYDDFWNGDCQMTRFYYKAWKIKREREEDDLDVLAYYVGAYVMEAIGATFGKSHYPRRPRSYDQIENNLSEEERAELWLSTFEHTHNDLPPTL